MYKHIPSSRIRCYLFAQSGLNTENFLVMLGLAYSAWSLASWTPGCGHHSDPGRGESDWGYCAPRRLENGVGVVRLIQLHASAHYAAVVVARIVIIGGGGRGWGRNTTTSCSRRVTIHLVLLVARWQRRRLRRHGVLVLPILVPIFVPIPMTTKAAGQTTQAARQRRRSWNLRFVRQLLLLLFALRVLNRFLLGRWQLGNRVHNNYWWLWRTRWRACRCRSWSSCSSRAWVAGSVCAGMARWCLRGLNAWLFWYLLNLIVFMFVSI